MEIFKSEKLTFSFPNSIYYGLKDVSFTVDEGQMVLLVGASGSGKTTLLKHLKPVISPVGEKEGRVLYKNTPVDEISFNEQAGELGFVFQNPENQIVSEKVVQELVFGMESLRFDNLLMKRRVSEIAAFFGIEDLLNNNINHLSGGQKQIINLASVMMMDPDVLILDEPTAQMDPVLASEFLFLLTRLNKDLGKTIILSEQRLEEALPLADKVLVLDGGELIYEGTPKDTVTYLYDNNHQLFMSMPTPSKIHGFVKNQYSMPLTVLEGRKWLNKMAEDRPLNKISKDVTTEKDENEKVINLKNIWFKYEKDSIDVIKNLSLKAGRGEFLTIMGGNGTGKTTLLTLISGVNKHYRGEAGIKGKVGMLPQNPETLFLEETLKEDLMEIGAEEKVLELSRLLQIEKLLGSHPYDLSQGEQQRAALCKVLLTEPDILLLDEPTKGMDYQVKKILASIINTLTDKGITVIMVSHDVEFTAEFGEKCALMFSGEIIASSHVSTFFKENSFYTTQANRMARNLLPDTVTWKDVVEALGEEVKDYRGEHKDKALKKDQGTKEEKNFEKKKMSKKTITQILVILLLIPLTIFLGMNFSGARKYFITSLLVIFESIIPFALVFERRKPQARELTLISVLCAIGVFSRAAFFAIPAFKPVSAIVIISGTALGAEAGFLVGSVTMFLSNLIFGQGPWTPWQMFAMGLIGFLSGIIFHKKTAKPNKFALSIFGAAAVLLVYGVLMNISSLMVFYNDPTWPMVLSVYLLGLPFDIVHAVATVIFLLLLTKPMISKLSRVIEKYGILF